MQFEAVILRVGMNTATQSVDISKKISVRAEWLSQSGRTLSELSETPQ
jgi:hypothetical protein